MIFKAALVRKATEKQSRSKRVERAMEGHERREAILRVLNERSTPIRGSELASMFSVSRQVIVQDIGLLRAMGEKILSTPRGYVLARPYDEGLATRVIACKHLGEEELKDELTTIVDLGGKVIDVVVEHPIYGELRGMLMISSRADVEEFVKALRESEAKPLSALTEGVHLHTVQAKDESGLDRIERALGEKGYLFGG